MKRVKVKNVSVYGKMSREMATQYAPITKGLFKPDLKKNDIKCELLNVVTGLSDDDFIRNLISIKANFKVHSLVRKWN